MADNKNNKNIKSKIDANDVACAAGVSPATISRAFANKNISSKTRNHVLRIAKKLGYYPDAFASGLNKETSRLVILIFDERQLNEWEFQIIDKFSSYLRIKGFLPIVQRLSSEDQYEKMRSIAVWRASGIIVFNDLLDATILSKAFKTSSLIIVNAKFVSDDNINVDHIVLDEQNGLYPMVNDLIANKRKRFVWIGGNGIGLYREKVIRSILSKNGLSLIDCVQGDYSYDSGYMKTLLMCRRTPKIDTIMCANDSMAIGAMDAVRHTLNLKVPNDIAITGYDDVPQASWSSYSLTTVREGVDEILTIVMNFFETRLDNQTIPARFYTLKSQYIPRQSTTTD